MTKMFRLSMLVVTLVFGITFIGCDSGSSSGASGNSDLVGTWVDEDGQELKVKDGRNFEMAFGDVTMTKGTYSVTGDKITAQVTHVYGPSLGMYVPEGISFDPAILPAGWLAEEDIQGAIEEMLLKLPGVTPEMIPALLEGFPVEEMKAEMFAPITGSFIIDGDELTMITEDEEGETVTTVHTRKNGEITTGSSSSVKTESSSSAKTGNSSSSVVESSGSVIIETTLVGTWVDDEGTEIILGRDGSVEASGDGEPMLKGTYSVTKDSIIVTPTHVSGAAMIALIMFLPPEYLSSVDLSSLESALPVGLLLSQVDFARAFATMLVQIGVPQGEVTEMLSNPDMVGIMVDLFAPVTSSYSLKGDELTMITEDEEGEPESITYTRK